MGEQKRVFMLIGLMILASGIVGTTVFTFLYGAAMTEERGRLTETVKSQARLIEAIARHDMAHEPHQPGGAMRATLDLIADAHENYRGFGKTGTFTLARREGDHIVFLLVHCGEKMVEPLSVPWHSNLAQPMRHALSDRSGTMIGLDYGGKEVLAAYEPVAFLDLGIVAKMDVSEIRAPFIRAGLLAGLVMVMVSFVAAFLFVRITRPMIRRIEDHARDLEKTVGELARSEERSRRMIDRNPDAILILDRGGEILFANPASRSLFGHDPEALVGADLGLPSIEDEFSEINIAGPDGHGKSVEMRSQSIRWAHTEAFIVSLRDVSEQKKAADRIQRLNEALRAIRDVNLLITREKNPDLLIEAACRILTSSGRFKGAWIALLDENQKFAGLSRAGIHGGFNELSQLFSRGELPNCVKNALSRTDAVAVGKGPEVCGDCPVSKCCANDNAWAVPLIQDNRHYGVLVISAPSEMVVDEEDRSLFREAGDDIAFALKSIETAEKQRRFQDALRQSEARFRLLVENAPVGIIAVDKGGMILDFNEKGFAILSVISPGIFSWGNLLTFPLLMDAGISEDVKRCLETGVSASHEHPCNTDGGGRVHLRYHLASIGDSENAVVGVQVIMEDISATRNLEGQLRQAQKMEAIGTLAGGIAHDFNNILAAILGYTQLVMEEIPPNSSFYPYLKQILKAGERARELVKQILTFSRQAETEPIPLKPHLIIKEAVKLLRSTIPTSIDIRQHVFPDTGMIVADPTQIHQVIMNLCTNAYQAMVEKGGTLEISIKNVEILNEDHVLKVCTDLKPGPHICLTVKDTGSGIRPHALEHIFDPYFTTKEKGRGTGLGLAVVHGIVGDCRGGIVVESEVGKGTRFDVFFPRLVKATGSLTEKSETPVQGGSERLLLVDDEAAIVDVGKQMLEKLGYGVETSTSSLEALKRFSHAPDTFDLLITDMAMPNMSGEKLAAEIIKIRPDFPVIICTGFSEVMDEEMAAARGIRAFLMKPLDRDVLSRTVRTVLDG